MKRKKSKWLGFFLGMVIYALIVLIAASFALKLLWDYADNYERSLPNRRMAAYVSTLDETHVKKISLDFVSSLDRSIQSESDAYAVIWRCFVGGVQYELVSTDSEGRTITYEVRNRDNRLGLVTFAKSDVETRNPSSSSCQSTGSSIAASAVSAFSISLIRAWNTVFFHSFTATASLCRIWPNTRSAIISAIPGSASLTPTASNSRALISRTDAIRCSTRRVWCCRISAPSQETLYRVM